MEDNINWAACSTVMYQISIRNPMCCMVFIRSVDSQHPFYNAHCSTAATCLIVKPRRAQSQRRCVHLADSALS
ncbi:hypothetical protein T09_8779 [Trichinella sp. T9]|nr:hypothetical protein T09_8779 [Trichinella sp. T9]